MNLLLGHTFLPLSSASVALQRWIPSTNRGDEQAEAEQGTDFFRSLSLFACHRWQGLALIQPDTGFVVLAGVHGLQEGKRQDANVSQEPTPAGVQFLERACSTRGAQHLRAQVLPAQGEWLSYSLWKLQYFGTLTKDN